MIQKSKAFLFCSYLICNLLFFYPQLVLGTDVQQSFSNRENYPAVFQKLEATANYGDAKAQYNLAEMYEFGCSVPKDKKEAFKWHQMVTYQRMTIADFKLGIMYMNGQDVIKDEKKAFMYFLKAADGGMAIFQFATVMNGYSRDVTKDNEQTVQWYALQGLAIAQSILVVYDHGRGVPKDDKQFFKLYLKVVLQKYAKAQYTLAFMYQHGRGVPKNDEQAIHWYQKAALQGLAEAQYGLGVMYSKGQGVPKNDEQAVHWYQKAALQGLAIAQSAFAEMYEHGRGIPRDEKEAVHWYQKAVDQRLAKAQRRLAVMYEHGRGVRKDHRKAIELMQQAAQQKESLALFNLGWLTLLGRGIQQNSQKAFQHWDAAAQLDVKESAHYVTLKSIFDNMTQASKDQIKRYKHAFLQREQEAQEELGIKTALTEHFYDSKAALNQALERGDRNAHYIQAMRYFLGIGKRQDFGETTKHLKWAARESHLLATIALQNMYKLGQGVVIDQLECLKWQIHLLKHYHLGFLQIDDYVLDKLLSQFQSVGWRHEILEDFISPKKLGHNVRIQEVQEEEERNKTYEEKQDETTSPKPSICPQRIPFSNIKNLYDVFLFDMGGVVTDGIKPFPYAIKTINLLANQPNKKIFFISNSARPSQTVQSTLIKYGIKKELINKDNIQVIAAGDVIRHDLDSTYKGKKIYHFSFGENRNEDLLKGMPHTVVDHPKEADLILLSQFIEKQEGQKDDELFADYEKQLKAVAKCVKKNKECMILCANPDIEAFHGSTKRYCAGAFARRLRENYHVPEDRIISYGKPDQKIYDYIEQTSPSSISKDRWIMVGDTLDNDIGGAKKFGIDSVLVLTGNTKQEIETQEREEDLWTFLIRYYKENDRIAPKYIMNSLTDDF